MRKGAEPSEGSLKSEGLEHVASAWRYKVGRRSKHILGSQRRPVNVYGTRERGRKDISCEVAGNQGGGLSTARRHSPSPNLR